MAHPPVIIVDSKDREIGQARLREVWEKGLLHRIVRVLVVDRNGRILLQRRALDMELYPGCWDVSAAGHVDVGKSYEFAARQELVEELGLAEGELEEIAYYKSHEKYQGRLFNRFNKLYRVNWNYTPELYSPEEVMEVRWVERPALFDFIVAHPERISDGLRQTASLLFGKKPKAASTLITSASIL